MSTTAQPRRAAIYLRISQDREGEEFGIGTQRKRTRQLAEARGWSVVEEYVDNSVSASKKRGPGTAWHEMLRAAERGEFDLIVAVDLDRLLRQTSDLNDLIATGARVVTVDGEIDLSTADGEFRATMLAGIARFEVRRKSERQRRANQQRREQGHVVNARRIPGYADDHVTVVEEEAEVVAKTFTDFLGGVSLRQLARDLEAAGIKTTRGRTYSPRSVKLLLENPRYAGLVPRHETGETYPGSFPAIVPREQWEAVQQKLTNPSRRSSPGNSPRWLLSGIAKCGRCGKRELRVGNGHAGAPRYRCGNHLARMAEPIDAYLSGILVRVLSRPDISAQIWGEREDGVDHEALSAERVTVQSRLDGLAGLYADGILDGASVTKESNRLRERIAEIDEALDVGSGSSPLGLVIGREDVQATWDALDVERKRMIVRALTDVTILPSRSGMKGFDPDLIQIDWKH
ncbi:recombinase family protein [Brevibacterium sp.]|uniref:recombinase family protein n=1 Tax=Brevibacterium sp. TaxID=1701 RepID=UPI0025C45D24|nr:recombinase family protein [Brevibacterium sp.]